ICLAAAATELSPISYLLVGVVKRALFRSGMSALRILPLPEVDGIDEDNVNDEVGSGVNIGNGIRNGGNGYDVGEARDSGGVGMASNHSTSDSERNGKSMCG
nr:hypothetical protein [Tanacetum cinerariifolium]